MDLVPAAILVVLAMGAARAPWDAFRADGSAAAVAAAVSSLGIAALALTVWLRPAAYVSWAQEDGWFESLTVCVLLAAAYRWARAAISESGRWRAIAAALALGCFAIAGEEISWGQRLLAIAPPEYLLQNNFQQELNVHNLFQSKTAAVRITGKQMVLALALVLAAAAVAGRVVGSRRTPPLWLLPAAGAAIWLESVYPIELSGEAAELIVAWVLAAAPWRWRPEISVTGLASATAVTAAAVVTLTLATDVLRRDDPRIELTRAELSALTPAMPATAPTAKLFGRRRVHKRLYTAVEDGYLALRANDQTPRSRYFIDPWGNPYWVSWDRASHTITLYSFGPNARRDGGDDISVAIQTGHSESPPPPLTPLPAALQ